MPTEIDLRITQLSCQLKNEVAAYELESFAGFFTYFIKHRPIVEDGPLNNFYSKLKDYLYLIALNATAANRGNKEMAVDDPIIGKWAKDLKEIKSLYQQSTLGNIQDLKLMEDSKNKVIHYMSFHTYFENGTLSYVEQDIDRMERVFIPYDAYLIKDFGFNTEFVVSLYRFSEMVSAAKQEQASAFSRTPEFAEFMMTNNGNNWTGRINKLPNEVFNGLEKFNNCTHISFKFSKEEYCAAFPKANIECFLDLFTFKPERNDQYLYFTQSNPLEYKPILLLPSGEYLHTYQKQIPLAVSKFLYEHLLKNPRLSDKLRKHRDRALELKTEDIFRKFFGRDERTFFYTNYHADHNTEQDILILSKNIALIIEIKASKYREPFRNPIKGFERLKSDFKESIQYGYDQCLRIEDKFFEDQTFIIYDKSNKPLYNINPKKYDEIYSIVVTLERFGPIQSDLNLMLHKDEKVDFPWAVYVDDLETFLLALKKNYKYPILPFKQFLKERKKFHGKAYVTDEMDICGAFLSNPKLVKELAGNDQASTTFLPDNQEIFDELYFSGLGFDNELFVETKKKRKLGRTTKTQVWRYK